MKSKRIPHFHKIIKEMPEDSRLFVDKGLSIIERIHFLLEKRGWNQRDLAQKLGKNDSEISRMITGMQNFTLRTITKLEAVFGEPIITIPKMTLTITVDFQTGPEMEDNFNKAVADLSEAIKKKGIMNMTPEGKKLDGLSPVYKVEIKSQYSDNQ